MNGVDMVLIVAGTYKRAKIVAELNKIEDWFWCATIPTALRLMGRMEDRKANLPEAVVVDKDYGPVVI